MKKLSAEEILELFLYEEIQKEINGEFIKKLNDPNYVMEMTPATYDSEETRIAYEKHAKKIDKKMKQRRKRLDAEEGTDQ